MNAPQFINFGCRLNTLETEVMRQQAPAQALQDTVVINTCAVTAEAMRQARQAIRRAKRQNMAARIVVTGCAAQLEPETFASMDEVDLVLGNEEKLHPSALADFGVSTSEKVLVNDIFSVRETAGHMLSGFSDRARAFVQVQNGCDHRCTFCIIPYARGNSRSVPAGAVINQVKALVDNGYREVVLTGVDITAYGSDLPAPLSLGGLCQKILHHVPDLARLRLSSIDTIEADEALVDVIVSEPRLMPHLHLSIQSGDDLILKRMKRRHGRDDIVGFCNTVRSARPDVVFGADLIAGFPTETEAMFNNTLALVNDAGLTYLHVFPFSPRRGTPAAKMPQLPKAVKKERAARLRAAGDAAKAAYFDTLVGRSSEVLVEKSDAGTGFGHTPQYAPIYVDGGLPGIGSVRVTGHDGATLTGIAAE